MLRYKTKTRPGLVSLYDTSIVKQYHKPVKISTGTTYKNQSSSQ